MPEISASETPVLTPRLTRLIAAALLVVFATLLIASSRQESQTFDEPDHLLAGFEYWRHGDFGRNPEHPPFAKMLAALPLLSMGLKDPPPVPFPYFKGQDMVNAAQLLYSANADDILFRGRFVIVLFSLATALLVFLATQEIFGPLAALIALALFTFEPTLLANGALVTTDMPLACLFFASIYAFYRYVERPSPARLALTALAAGLTIVTKHSGILILPFLALLAAIDAWVESPMLLPEARRSRVRQLTSALLLITAASYLILWAIYGFRFAARPGALLMVPTLADFSAAIPHPWQRSVIASFARYHLVPQAYLYGWADILLIPSTRPTFLFGHLYSSGRWFFFPAVFVIKTTLTLLILLALLPFAGIQARGREFLFFALPPVFFFLVAISSMLNLGVRHLLPIYPFCIVLAGAAAASLLLRSTASRVAIAALLLFAVISSLHSYPDFLAYSNEAFGGPSHTYRIVTDSNVDWGQELKWERTYVDRHPGDCWIVTSNPTVPTSYYGIRCKPLLSGLGHFIGFGVPPIPPTITGTVLLSSTEANGLMWGPDSLNPYEGFRNRPPDDMIGNAVLVFRGTFNVPLLAAENNAAAAVTMFRQQQLPQALALARTAVDQAPNSADVNAIYGEILLASGHVPEGHQTIGRAIQLAQSNHPEFQKFLLAQLQQPPSPH